MFQTAQSFESVLGRKKENQKYQYIYIFYLYKCSFKSMFMTYTKKLFKKVNLWPVIYSS